MFPLVTDLSDRPSDLQELPSLQPSFFVPVLSEKPQDPILDTLKREKPDVHPVHVGYLPPELALFLEPPSPPLRLNESIWIEAIQKHSIMGRVCALFLLAILPFNGNRSRVVSCPGMLCGHPDFSRHRLEAFFLNRIVLYSLLPGTSGSVPYDRRILVS